MTLSSYLVPRQSAILKHSLASPSTPALRVVGETVPPAATDERRVLVVVDTRHAVRALRKALRGLPIETTWSSLAEDVLRQVIESRPDLVCLAVSRLEEPVLGLCRRLRAFDPGGLRAIVVVGGNEAADGDAAAAIDAGADDYVPGLDRGAELRARLRGQLRHLRDREVMRWAKAQRKSLREQAHHDPLTGVLNRRGLARELSRGDMARANLAVAAIDLDHFKAVNDTFGHAIGDLMLCRVARALECASDEGIVARLGGEEFAVIVRADRAPTLCDLGERLRLAVHELSFSDVHPELTASASVGVAWGRGTDAADIGCALTSADAALYDAKRLGRNCVIVSPRGASQQGRSQ